MRAERSTLVGIALLCFANLLLEVLITRLFSATMFYHFTFMAVGLAMFGIAASGVYVFVNAERFQTDLQAHLSKHARWFAVSTLVGLIFITANPVFGGGELPQWSPRVFWQLLMLIVFTALPFFFAGVCVSLALTFFRANVNRVYFYDLAGAAGAALLCGVLLGLLGGPSTGIFAATAALIAAELFRDTGRRRWLLPALGLLLVAFNVYVPIIQVGKVKWEGSIRYEKWNVFSRITVDTGRQIKIDAGAATHIEDLRGMTPDMGKDKITALALYTWETPPEKVLIIGPGGGRDILFALARGSKDITGVEINPIIANDVMRGKWASKSGHLYEDPRVHIHVDEGRSFIRRSDEKYDMVQASLVDTWAATAAGAFALTENTLYTLEAFQDYFAHLTDRGVVTMTRFYIDAPHHDGNGESPRLLLLAAGALETRGVAPKDARKHIFFAVSSDEPQGTLIAKRTEFTPDEVTRLEQTAAAGKMKVLVSPNTDGSTLLERYIDQGAWSDLVASAEEELKPPTDDRPFFFFFKKFGDLFDIRGKTISDPGLWVVVSLGSVLALGVFFILLPLVVRIARGGMQAHGESRAAKLSVLSYFGVVGFAFMAVEIALMQRFTLFLGHPSYSLLVILFVVLLATAIGARVSERYGIARLGRVMLIAGLALGVLTAIYGVVLGDLLRALIALPRPARIVITAILATPCGLLMGVMVPSAVRVLGAANSPLVPWGWGVNGATSVIGTSIATIIAMYGGFTATFLVGAACYAGAGLLGRSVARHYPAAKPKDSPKLVDKVEKESSAVA